MHDRVNFVSRPVIDVMATNKLIRQTYTLLSMTVLFSALMAAVSMNLDIQFNFLVILAGYFGLLYLVNATANSAMGLVAVFMLTGFMGLTLGPVLTSIARGYVNGNAIIAGALGSTGVIFLALSGYALTTKKDFSYLAGFLIVGLLVTMIASICSIFFHIETLHLISSAVVVLLMSGFILYDTSRLVHGGETNYILATVSLYVTLFNLFVRLLHIFSALAGRRD